jgi:hypothetical protein
MVMRYKTSFRSLAESSLLELKDGVTDIVNEAFMPYRSMYKGVLRVPGIGAAVREGFLQSLHFLDAMSFPKSEGFKEAGDFETLGELFGDCIDQEIGMLILGDGDRTYAFLPSFRARSREFAHIFEKVSRKLLKEARDYSVDTLA